MFEPAVADERLLCGFCCRADCDGNAFNRGRFRGVVSESLKLFCRNRKVFVEIILRKGACTTQLSVYGRARRKTISVSRK